jgi:flagellar hook-associated protein 1 FlgK
MDNGTATMEENYLKSIGKLGLQTGKNRLDEEQSDGLYAQAKSIKERVTGVSIDEEAGNLIRFQHAYEASAKVMKTAEEMFDTIMSIKR